VYDPVIGRFLSPDPFIQLPYFTQSFNNFSYCLNNPLRYVDPSGYSNVCPNDNPDALTAYYYACMSGQFQGSFGDFEVQFYEQYYKGLAKIGGNIGGSIAMSFKFYTWEREADTNGDDSADIIEKKVWHTGTMTVKLPPPDNPNNYHPPLFPFNIRQLGGAGVMSTILANEAKQSAKIVYKYGKRVNGKIKSNTQITNESKKALKELSKSLEVVGGTIGATVNGIETYNSYTEGDTFGTIFNGSKTLFYIGGTILLFVPGFEGLGVSILWRTTVVDVAGDIIEDSL